MKWNNIKITIFKELRGIVRDKKSLQKIIFLPLIIPIVIIAFGFLFDVMSNSNYVIGTNYNLSSEEKELIKKYDNISFKNYKNKDELNKAYEDKKIDGYIIKNNNKYTIYSDISSNSGEMVNHYASSYLDEYNKVLANNYLIKNNVDLAKVYNNIVVDNKSLAKDEANPMFTIILSLSITYILMIVVMACITVATDATSGEKERGTLETILTFPIKSKELVAGKYLATSVLGFMVGLFAYILTVPSILVAKKLFTSFKDINASVSITTASLVLLIIIISALLSAGVCIALSGKAKTYKEAQSSLQIVSFLPMIPYFAQIMEADSNIFSFVPIANCGMALNDLIINKLNPNSLIIIILSSIVYIIAILLYISKQYKKEDTLFG